MHLGNFRSIHYFAIPKTKKNDIKYLEKFWRLLNFTELFENVHFIKLQIFRKRILERLQNSGSQQMLKLNNIFEKKFFKVGTIILFFKSYFVTCM